jgi:two-component system cell cycle response regulator
MEAPSLLRELHNVVICNMKMKKEILIFETDKAALKFLRSYFKERNDYSVRFIKKDGNILKKELAERRPDALILSSPDGLRHLKPSEIQCPIIAMIATNLSKGIRSVIESDVECYLLRPFHKDDLDNKLRVAVKQKSWAEKLYKENKDLQAIIELTYLISSTLKPKEVLTLIVKKISELIKVTRCSIISIAAENPEYASVVSVAEDPEIANLTIDLRKYPEIRKALVSKKPAIIKDVKKDRLMKEVRDIIAPVGIRSIIVIPVILHDEVIGTLLLRTSRAGHAFTDREIKLCIGFANASANALYNAFLYERLDKERTKLESLAITDYLTGVYNIRYFYNRLEEEFSRAVRYHFPLSCMMFDIDHFKRINDSHGHRIGDIVLREFAQLVRSHIRKSDIFARYGGEEFIMLLPQTSLKGAIREAERLRQALKEHRFNALKEKSIGITNTNDKRIKTQDDLITFADHAMFTAKNRGRDQIIVYSSLE